VPPNWSPPITGPPGSRTGEGGVGGSDGKDWYGQGTVAGSMRTGAPATAAGASGPRAVAAVRPTRASADQPPTAARVTDFLERFRVLVAGAWTGRVSAV
jgi:hypothetical protein